MTGHRTVSLVAFVLLGLLPVSGQTAPNAAGHWEGKIQIPNHELAVSVDLATTGSGQWIGSVSIPDSATDLPLSDIAVDGRTIRFSATLPGRTTFEGTLNVEATEVSGTVANAEGGVPFQLIRSGEASVKVPPPSSVLPKAFDGTWQGAVDRDGKTRRVLIRLSAAPDGTAVAHPRRGRPGKPGNPGHDSDGSRQRAAARRPRDLRYLPRHTRRRRCDPWRMARALRSVGAHDHARAARRQVIGPSHARRHGR